MSQRFPDITVTIREGDLQADTTHTNYLPDNDTNITQTTLHNMLMPLENELEERRRQLKVTCSTNSLYQDHVNLENVTASTTIYVDDKYKVLYCPIHKVATSNWRRVLMVLAGDVKNESQVGKDHYLAYTSKHKPLKTFSPAERLRRIHTYKKFFFVRHPFERLVSAFRDKFEMGVAHEEWWYMKTFGVPIKKWAHPEMSARELDAQKTKVTFEEFIGYVTAFANTKQIDMHWDQYHRLCRPCDIDYDIIGKYETLDRDTNFVLHEIGVYDIVHFPTTKLNNHNTHTSVTSIDSYMSQLSPTVYQNLKEVYSLDFEMFGYDMM
ncbi:carbohydrate sulfotransferase 8-like isoform X2 [Saccoglossus kowalevskii]